MKDEQSRVLFLSMFALSQISQHLQSSSQLHDHLLTVFLKRDVQQQLEPLRQNHRCWAAFTTLTTHSRHRERQEVLQEVALQSGKETKGKQDGGCLFMGCMPFKIYNYECVCWNPKFPESLVEFIGKQPYVFKNCVHLVLRFLIFSRYCF